MKSLVIISLGTLVFLSSDGRAQNDELFSESQPSSLHVLPLNSEDFPDTPSLGTQNISLGSSFDELIQRGRPGGFSPHITGHLSDLLNTTPPQTPSQARRLRLTRGLTFYIPGTNNHDDGN